MCALHWEALLKHFQETALVTGPALSLRAPHAWPQAGQPVSTQALV